MDTIKVFLEKVIKVIRRIKTYSTGYQGIIYTINNLKIKFLNTAYQDESDSSLILLMVILQNNINMIYQILII